VTQGIDKGVQLKPSTGAFCGQTVAEVLAKAANMQ
jgi:hypothetical protein